MAVFLVALIIGIVTWLILGRNENSSSPTTAVVSEQGLQKLVGALAEPVYLVGPEQWVRYGV